MSALINPGTSIEILIDFMGVCAVCVGGSCIVQIAGVTYERCHIAIQLIEAESRIHASVHRRYMS